MFNALRRWLVAGVAALLVGGVCASASQAAPPTRVIVRPVVTVPLVTPRINPTFVIPPLPPVPQYGYNPNVLGRGYSNVLANNANIAYATNVTAYNAYLSSLYAMPYVSPYNYSAYTPFLYNPYYYNPYGPAGLGLYP
jgi:hypothetical protein